MEANHPLFLPRLVPHLFKTRRHKMFYSSMSISSDSKVAISQTSQSEAPLPLLSSSLMSVSSNPPRVGSSQTPQSNSEAPSPPLSSPMSVHSDLTPWHTPQSSPQLSYSPMSVHSDPPMVATSWQTPSSLPRPLAPIHAFTAFYRGDPDSTTAILHDLYHVNPHAAVTKLASLVTGNQEDQAVAIQLVRRLLKTNPHTANSIVGDLDVMLSKSNGCETDATSGSI